MSRDAVEEEADVRRRQRQVGVDEITLENVRLGKITAEDLAIRRQTLLRQAEKAEAEGYAQLARNFRRAAELTALPNDVLLAAYEKLRPQRATYYELLALSQEIAARYDAPETGRYIREAAEVCRERGLLLPDTSDGKGNT